MRSVGGKATVNISASKSLSLIPGGYLAVTRIHGLRDLAYHLATSWLPAIWLVLQLTELSPAMAGLLFLAGYLAFIAAYEIGYLANDVWDARRSDGGRHRLSFAVDAPYLTAFLGIRLATWLVIGMAMNWVANPIWQAGYAILAIAFAQHNLVSSKGLRLASFYELATLRFLLPIAALLSAQSMVPALLVALLLYAFPRFLSYMESKDLLALEERRAPAFGFFLLLSFSPLVLYLAWVLRIGVLAELLAYFLAIHWAWWLLVSVRERPQSKE